MTSDQPLVQEGDVLTLERKDYCYGNGTLRMLVTHVPRFVDLGKMEWVHIRGTVLLRDGSKGQEGRVALVRVAALRKPGVVTRPESRQQR